MPQNLVPENILISGLVFTIRVSLEVLDIIREKTHAFCSRDGLTYIDNRNISGVHLCQGNLHLLQSGKKISLNNLISYLNSNFLMYLHPYKRGHKSEHIRCFF